MKHESSCYTLLNSNHNIYKAWNDLIQSFVFWRIFYVIGINDIRKRYVRSKIGQFWLTFSLAIHISTLGIVWAYLFKMPVKEYLPYLAVGTVFWTYISSCITEGSNLYISSAPYIRELNISKTIYINSLFVRNLIVLGHNLLVLIPIGFLFSMPTTANGILLAVCGLIITSVYLFPVIMLISLVSLRFRDLPNIITSIMQIAFYVTPIMWQTSLMPERFHKYLLLNPFAVLLSLCRDPLFYSGAPNIYWIAALAHTILAWCIAFPMFSKFRARIVYWL